MTRGKFLTLEGIDGAGKSTHLEWIASFLQGRAKRVTVTREPGGTALGEALRTLMLQSGQPLHPDTEALLMFAARSEHLHKVILPALDGGEWVVCDRFTDATYAYQSGGSGLEWERIRTLETWVQGELQPDLTLYFDVPVALGKARTAAARQPDRFEREAESFFERVRAAYLRRAQEQPSRVAVIDSSASLEQVRASVERLILSI